MKHTIKITVALVLFFFIAQVIGLLVINHYIDHAKTIETQAVVYRPLPYNIERPEIKNESYSFIYISIAILIGTGLALLLIKFRKLNLWRFWFFITILVTLSLAFAAFMNSVLAAILALIISAWKLYKPNLIIQNLSELFIYGGLASIFVPIINLFAAFMLLVVISVYDLIAVFKTKHMIRLAKFQSKSKVFAGFFIPYKKIKMHEIKPIESKKPRKITPEPEKSFAVLGGGDIGFTLIFAGVVMKGLMLKETVLGGFLKTLIIPLFVSIALLVLLLKARPNKFYPAMPILTLGCFIGYLVVLLV